MRPNKLRELLRADKPTIGTHMHGTWPSVVEMIGHTGLYDYVEFVAEYAPFDLYALDDLCRAAELHNLGTMIKVDAEPRTFLAQRAIGSGFESVLFADSHSADDVRECVRAAHPDTPEDKGSFGAVNRRFTYMGYGGGTDYVQMIRDVVVVIMVEKGGVVDELEEVLSIEGVDMIQWGPADYSMSRGLAGQRQSAEVVEAERRGFETALKMGVAPRAEIGTPDQARRFLDMGVRHFCMNADISILFEWWKKHGDELRKVVEGA